MSKPHTHGVVNPILDDITKSVEDILNSHAIQLNDFLRQQHAEVQGVIDAKNSVLTDIQIQKDKKRTDKIINDIEKKFESEEQKLIHETNKLKMAIIKAIREQNCDESKEKMLIVPDLLTVFTKKVKETTTVVEMYSEEEQGQHIFRNMMSGFKNKFYNILDRAQEHTNKAINKINKTFKTPVDVDYGISAKYDDNLSVSTNKTVLTNYTSRTAELLDKAFQPGIGCIATTGLEQLRVGLANVRDELYKFIFSDILSVSDQTSDIQRRREILDRGVPQGAINLGYDDISTQSSIDTEILPSIPGSPVSKTDTISSLGEIPPFYPPPDLRRTRTVPTHFVSYMASDLVSTKSDNPRLGQPIFKGKIRPRNGRTLRLDNPLGKGKTHSNRNSPQSRRRSISTGGKKHRKTAHKRKNN